MQAGQGALKIRIAITIRRNPQNPIRSTKPLYYQLETPLVLRRTAFADASRLHGRDVQGLGVVIPSWMSGLQC